MNKKGEQFLMQYPNAAKVYLNNAKDKLFGTTGVVTLVNGAKAAVFREGTLDGFFVLPGESVVEVQFHKVTSFILFTRHSYTKSIPYRIYTETNKNYSLKYSFKTNEITFGEYVPK